MWFYIGWCAFKMKHHLLWTYLYSRLVENWQLNSIDSRIWISKHYESIHRNSLPVHSTSYQLVRPLFHFSHSPPTLTTRLPLLQQYHRFRNLASATRLESSLPPIPTYTHPYPIHIYCYNNTHPHPFSLSSVELFTFSHGAFLFVIAAAAHTWADCTG